MTGIVDLDEAAACEVHALLAGRETRLGEHHARATRSSGSAALAWRVPVTAKTVHRLPALHLLASDAGVRLVPDVATGLDEREATFHEDFLARGVTQESSASRQVARFAAENLELLRDTLRALLGLPALLRAPAPTDASAIGRALLIGQYGGEHVGDAAILGGVLLRLHEEYGATRAHLLSHRPDHTRRLAAGLEIPLALHVHAFEPARVESLLDEVDALVFAGGPIMDLPRVLVKQMATVAAARSRGLPVLIDRVGIGPFTRRTSRVAARTLVRSAARLSVRTRASAADPVVAGLDPEIRRDPAFDYLAARGPLTRLPDADARAVEELLRGSDGRLRVGINLRPIRHLWSPRGESFSRSAEEAFTDRFAEALVRCAAEAKRPPCFVFFPMNPQEFGGSDLRAAYRLHRRVGSAADLRVWEGDPDVDGIVHLLRNLDAAITMRFHASIFALSQRLPTFGIDYYPGQGGKVEQLFHDLGRPDDVRRMEAFDADWLVEGLTRLEAERADAGVETRE